MSSSLDSCFFFHFRSDFRGIQTALSARVLLFLTDVFQRHSCVLFPLKGFTCEQTSWKQLWADFCCRRGSRTWELQREHKQSCGPVSLGSQRWWMLSKQKVSLRRAQQRDCRLMMDGSVSCIVWLWYPALRNTSRPEKFHQKTHRGSVRSQDKLTLAYSNTQNPRYVYGTTGSVNVSFPLAGHCLKFPQKTWSLSLGWMFTVKHELWSVSKRVWKQKRFCFRAPKCKPDMWQLQQNHEDLHSNGLMVKAQHAWSSELWNAGGSTSLRPKNPNLDSR